MASLLAWAAELAEQELVLPDPVSHAERPFRAITTQRVSECATIYLREISPGHTYRRTGCWGHFTPEWWWDREQEALGALAALREAKAIREKVDGSGAIG